MIFLAMKGSLDLDSGPRLATLQQRLEPCHATCISRLDAGTSGLLPVALEGPSSRASEDFMVF